MLDLDGLREARAQHGVVRVLDRHARLGQVRFERRGLVAQQSQARKPDGVLDLHNWRIGEGLGERFGRRVGGLGDIDCSRVGGLVGCLARNRCVAHLVDPLQL